MFETILSHDGEDHAAHAKAPKPNRNKPAKLPHDPVVLPRLSEHTALHYLLRYSDVSIFSVKSGCWCETSTWNAGRLPNEDDRVCILAGHTVTIDETDDVCLTCRIDGTLEFNRTSNTQLRVETLGNFGTLEIGTPGSPIAENVSARVIFRDTGPLDSSRDPLLQSRGLISYGELRIYGAEKAPFARLDTGVTGDATALGLQEAPAGWQVGDTLIIPSTTYPENQDETVTITELDGSHLRVEPPLRFSHSVASEDAPLMTSQGESEDTALSPDEGRRQFIPIANLSRNVTLESENAGDVRRRAHVMLMGLEPVSTCYVHFKNMGRTDKSRIIVDTPNDVGAEGSNERARYAWHCHRMGVESGARPALADGCVVSGSPGWGFVNHSSHALIQKCVAYGCTGAGFATEVGNEFGEFKNCLSIRTPGSGGPENGEEDPQRSAIYDFGHMGFGFWFQGMGCSIEGNTAFGAGAAGFGISNTNMNREWTPTYNTERFPIGNTPDPAIFDNPPYGSGVYSDKGELDRANITFRFKSNTCAASKFGLESWRFGGHAPLYKGVTRHIENFTVWGCGFALFLNYSSDFTFVKCWLRGNGNDPSFGGWGAHELDGWMMIGDDNAVRRTFTDCRVEGFRQGLQWFPEWIKVERGFFDNTVNFLVLNIPYTLEVSGTLFGPREGAVDFTVDRGRDSGPDTIVLFNGRRLFYRAQAPAGSVEATKGARLRGLYAPPTAALAVAPNRPRTAWRRLVARIGGRVAT